MGAPPASAVQHRCPVEQSGGFPCGCDLGFRVVPGWGWVHRIGVGDPRTRECRRLATGQPCLLVSGRRAPRSGRLRVTAAGNDRFTAIGRAAFDIADGMVIGELPRRRRAIEFRKFLVRIGEAVPANLEVHLVCDNYATHKPPRSGPG